MKRGFSLLEILIGMGLISVGLLTLIGVYTQGLRLLNRGQEMTLASEVGREFLMQVEAQGYAVIPAEATVFDGRIPDPKDEETGFPPFPYPETTDQTMKLEVSTFPVGELVQSVTVKVFYDEQSYIKFQTYFCP